MEQDNGSIDKIIKIIAKITNEANFCCNASMDTEEVLISLGEIVKILNKIKIKE